MVNQILIAAPISEKFRTILLKKKYSLLEYEAHEDIDSTNITGIVTSNKLLLTESVLKKFPQLRWIGRMGSGMETLDCGYCDQNGIPYFSSPQGIANSVAEHIVGMLLCLQHRILHSFQEIKKGHWNRESNRGRELENLTLGIIGYGHTGSALAKKMSVFTRKIIAYDKYKTGFSNKVVKEVSLAQLQNEADILSFHVPLNEETFHYYNEIFLSQTVHNHILINASRGAVADTAVILQGLKSGKISAACLDVFEEENRMQTLLREEHNIIKDLLAFPVVLTPHIAGYSFEAIEKMSDELIMQLEPLL